MKRKRFSDEQVIVRLCPLAWCSWGRGQHGGRQGRTGQAARVGGLTAISSPGVAIVSKVT